jgi:hypothetical protein
MPRRNLVPALTDEKKSVVVAMITVGASRRVAANYVGCSPSTIRRTAARDPDFAARLKKATSDEEMGCLGMIRRAAKKEQYWRAAAWILERVHPDRYARRGPDVITVPQITQIITQFSRIVTDEIPVARYRQRVIARLSELHRSISGRTPRWGKANAAEKEHETK